MHTIPTLVPSRSNRFATPQELPADIVNQGVTTTKDTKNTKDSEGNPPDPFELTAVTSIAPFVLFVSFVVHFAPGALRSLSRT